MLCNTNCLLFLRLFSIVYVCHYILSVSAHVSKSVKGFLTFNVVQACAEYVSRIVIFMMVVCLMLSDDLDSNFNNHTVPIYALLQVGIPAFSDFHSFRNSFFGSECEK